MKWMKVKRLNWATFLLEWWASTPPNVSSQLNPAVIWPQCLFPAIQKEKVRKSWQNHCYFSFLSFFFLICILLQGLAKRGPNLFLELHPKACSGMLHMLTNCWSFSTKDNDLHFTICCLSWNSRHPFKGSPSCWNRHTWSSSIRWTHLSCRHHIPWIGNNFSVIPIIVGGTDLSQ